MSTAPSNTAEQERRFRTAYARHRAAEGRTLSVNELLELPYLEHGPQASQWRVRSRTFDRFLAVVLEPLATGVATRPLRVADLGAGNGWLCYRIAQRGHTGLAIDLREDAVDGLGAVAAYQPHLPVPIAPISGSFEAIPLAGRSCDLAVFNASLHYALDLTTALAEAARIVMPGGRITILDSPFYAAEDDGQAMVREKQRNANRQFGSLAKDLMALPFIEFLTRERLQTASAALGFEWRRHQVRYPWSYELRRPVAAVRGRRAPSRFDLWETAVP